jgi:hypothetical protein
MYPRAELADALREIDLIAATRKQLFGFEEHWSCECYVYPSSSSNLSFSEKPYLASFRVLRDVLNVLFA